MNAKSVAYSFVLIALSTQLLGCPPNEFTPDPVLKFTNITVSQSRAQVGDMIEISWDYEAPELLKSQFAQGISLLLNGLSLTAPVDFDLNVRSLTFPFTGPVTVVLVAENEQTFEDDTVTADSVAFDILLDEASFFELTYQPVDIATQVPGAPSSRSFDFPRLGAENFSAQLLKFSQFVGFFDRPSQANGVVDALTPFLDEKESFRALSRNVMESLDFSMVQGSAYQPQSQFEPLFGLSNAYVFGGAIAYSGEAIPIKADDDEEFAGRRAGSLVFEPVFMAITLLVGFQTQLYDIVDIQLGNLSQGFVATLNTGTLNNGGELVRGIDGTVSIDSDSNGETNGTIFGTIKDAHIGFGVTTVNSDIFDSIIRIISADWSMPFLFDTDLAGRLDFTPGVNKTN